jgi:UDPglucose 6-dehydrogenase
MRSVAICGIGKLGAPLAVSFAAAGISTVAYDTDSKKIEALRRLQAPVCEPGLQELLETGNALESLFPTMAASQVAALSDACIFVTPTPSQRNGEFDHSHVREAVRSVAREVKAIGKPDYLFIVASTVTPGCMEQEIMPLLVGVLNGLPFGLVYKPELIRVGAVLHDLAEPPFLLIGSNRMEASTAVAELYKKILSKTCPAKFMSFVEAELAKISVNCMLTMRISFANQLDSVAKKMNADSRVILDAVGEDPRIGHAFLRPGLPFGGPCLPRDNAMFGAVARRVGVKAELARASDLINAHRYAEIADEADEKAGSLGSIGILGLSYKAGTSVIDESPGFVLLFNSLFNPKRKLLAHDPLVKSPNTIEEVCACDVVIVALDCEEYRTLTVSENTFLIDPEKIVRKLVRTNFRKPENAGAACL